MAHRQRGTTLGAIPARRGQEQQGGDGEMDDCRVGPESMLGDRDKTNYTVQVRSGSAAPVYPELLHCGQRFGWGSQVRMVRMIESLWVHSGL